jgi:Zinc knuckle
MSNGDTSHMSHSRAGYAHVPILTKYNFLEWQVGIRAYLRPGKHLRVIKASVDANGAATAPVAPADPALQEKWESSEEIAMGVIVATASKMHLELISKLEDGPAWDLWCAIEHCHMSSNVSLRREAWVQLYGTRKQPDEGYADYYRRGDTHNDRIDCVTPISLSRKEISEERLMTQLLYGLPADDSLRRQFISQSALTLADMWTAFLRIDRDASATAAIESANAAFAGACHKCDQRGHLSKECPYAEDIKRAVNTRISAAKKKGKARTNAVANAADAGSSAASSSTQESAGVASSFLSHQSSSTDVWVCDSGASSSMSNSRSAFTTFRPDRRPIRLADGKIVYSSGLGSMRFVSTYGYIVSIHNVVPLLAVNLFAANKFAKEYRTTHMEVTDHPMHKWVNRHTGATEFTATIRDDGI